MPHCLTDSDDEEAPAGIDVNPGKNHAPFQLIDLAHKRRFFQYTRLKRKRIHAHLVKAQEEAVLRAAREAKGARVQAEAKAQAEGGAHDEVRAVKGRVQLRGLAGETQRAPEAVVVVAVDDDLVRVRQLAD